MPRKVFFFSRFQYLKIALSDTYLPSMEEGERETEAHFIFSFSLLPPPTVVVLKKATPIKCQGFMFRVRAEESPPPVAGWLTWALASFSLDPVFLRRPDSLKALKQGRGTKTGSQSCPWKKPIWQSAQLCRLSTQKTVIPRRFCWFPDCTVLGFGHPIRVAIPIIGADAVLPLSRQQQPKEPFSKVHAKSRVKQPSCMGTFLGWRRAPLDPQRRISDYIGETGWMQGQTPTFRVKER